MSLLLRFYELGEGTITMDGRDIKEMNVKWLRSQVTRDSHTEMKSLPKSVSRCVRVRINAHS